MGDTYPEITKRIAVDVPGEDERIRRLLREAEAIGDSLDRNRHRRGAREQRAAYGKGYLCDSNRLAALDCAQRELDSAICELTSALCASGTITDEPPF